MTTRSVLIGCVALTLLACAAPPAPPVELPPADTLTISFAERLTWPYQLEQLSIALDGELLYHRLGAPYQQRIYSERVVDGEHTLSLAVGLSFATGTARDECRVQLRTSTFFDAPTGTGDVQIILFLRDLTVDFVERPEIAVRLRGLAELAAAGSGPTPRRPEPVALPPLTDEVDRIAIARELVDQARTRRDLIALNCYNDRLTLMVATTRLIEQRRLELAQAQSPDEVDHQQQVIAIAQERLDQTYRELENCVTYQPIDIPGSRPPTSRSVSGEGCRGRDEIPVATERP